MYFSELGIQSFDLSIFKKIDLDLVDLWKRSTVIKLISLIFEKDRINHFQDRIDLPITKNDRFDRKNVFFVCFSQINLIDSIFLKIESIFRSQKNNRFDRKTDDRIPNPGIFLPRVICLLMLPLCITCSRMPPTTLPTWPLSSRFSFYSL